MAWRVELAEAAAREIDQLDPPIARRILKFLHERIAKLDDPRSVGEALHGSKLGEFWKYRVGNYSPYLLHRRCEPCRTRVAGRE